MESDAAARDPDGCCCGRRTSDRIVLANADGNILFGTRDPGDSRRGALVAAQSQLRGSASEIVRPGQLEQLGGEGRRVTLVPAESKHRSIRSRGSHALIGLCSQAYQPSSSSASADHTQGPALPRTAGRSGRRFARSGAPPTDSRRHARMIPRSREPAQHAPAPGRSPPDSAALEGPRAVDPDASGLRKSRCVGMPCPICQSAGLTDRHHPGDRPCAIQPSGSFTDFGLRGLLRARPLRGDPATQSRVCASAAPWCLHGGRTAYSKFRPPPAG